MADFKTALQILLKHEGGFQKHPDDSGNWTGGVIGQGVLKGTKYGISAAQFPYLDIENLTDWQAGEIYRDGYWKSLYSQIMNQPVANKLFDLGVLFGVGTTVKVLQSCLDIKQDGLFGPICLAAVNSYHPVESLLSIFKYRMRNHVIQIILARPENQPFFNGWISRIQT